MDANKGIEVEVSTKTEVQDLTAVELALVGGGGSDGTHNGPDMGSDGTHN